MSKEIGGYLNLELKEVPQNRLFHSKGIFLNSGRNALEYILASIPTINKLWIPYFTCDVVLEPINKLGIPYSFYHINGQLELSEDIHLAKDEYLLITNYYGIKDSYIEYLANKYSSQLIVDNAQALFAKPIEGIKTFYSPRKFVGIPDGGIAYIDNSTDINSPEELEEDISYDRFSHLLKRIDLGAGAGYIDFKENSHKLVSQPIKRISKLTKKILYSIDFEEVKAKRIANFQVLHDALKHINQIEIPDISSFNCPLVYPFFCEDGKLKKKLIDKKIFVATYWPNVFNWCKETSLEYQFADRVIAIPIDQRYSKNEIVFIIKSILS